MLPMPEDNLQFPITLSWMVTDTLPLRGYTSSMEKIGQAVEEALISCQGSSESSEPQDPVLDFLVEVKVTLQNKEEEYSKFMQLMDDIVGKRIDSRTILSKAKKLFLSHSNLAHKFSRITGHCFSITDGLPKKRPATASDFRTFLIKAKDHLHNEQSFKSLLSAFQKDNILHKTRLEIYQEVTSVIGNHRELLEDYSCIMQDFAEPTSLKNLILPGKTIDRSSAAGLTCQITTGNMHIMNNPNHQLTINHVKAEEFTTKNKKRKDAYKEGASEAVSVKKACRRMMPEIKGCKTLRQWDCKAVPMKDSNCSKVFFPSNKVDNMDISSIELELSKCPRRTPSYVSLTKDNRPIDREDSSDIKDSNELNNTVRIVSVGTGECDSNLAAENVYKAMLFKCDDDIFEFDMLIERARSMSKIVEELLAMIANGTSENPRDLVKKHLTACHMRLIEQMYSEFWQDIVNGLREEPEPLLHVILGRLKQKEIEWCDVRESCRIVWSETIAKSYHRALDHHIFHVNGENMKSPSTKGDFME